MKRLVLVRPVGLLLAFVASAHADIFRWEYIDPADPSQGKRQSTMLAPDGAGVDAVPGANLSNRNLTMAYLIGADLTGAYGSYANLTNADLTRANFSNSNFGGAMLTDADFAEADIRGANLTRTGITLAQLYSTANYLALDMSDIHVDGDFLGANFEAHNLSHASFGNANLTSTNFRNANLANARFAGEYSCGVNNSLCRGDPFQLSADLTNADFTGAEIRGASFLRAGGSGIALAQLYSTASYQARDLGGIDLQSNNLAGGDFSRQNLDNANFGAATLDGATFREANLTNATFVVHGRVCIPLCEPLDTPAALTSADLTAADARGSDLFTLARTFFGGSQLVGEGAIATNLIRPDGHINGLDLGTASPLVVRDDDVGSSSDPYSLPVPITVDQHLSMSPGGTLRMVFEADAWDSTISFAPGIPVALGGTLDLTFADDVNLANQLGRTLKIFDWTGVKPTGAFAVSSRYTWDLSNLYTTGEVTLTAIPEPGTLALAALGLIGLVVRIRRSKLNEESHAETQRRRGGHSSLRPQRLCVSLLSLLVFAASTHADIFQWEYINAADPGQGKRQSTTLAPEGAGVDAVPGTHLSPRFIGILNESRNLTMAYLNGVDLNHATLRGANLQNASVVGANLFAADFSTFCNCPFWSGMSPISADLTAADLSQANLTNANFAAAILTDTDFTDAEIRGANFAAREFYCSVESCNTAYGTGITLDQLYSTASYQAHDLTGITLRHNDLAGGNFAGQNLTNSRFFGDYTRLEGADFTAADARGANLDAAGAITTNLIWPWGQIDDLDLDVGGLLMVRDYDGGGQNHPFGHIPITVDQHLTMASGGTLRMVFEADAWDSTISFASGIPVTLGGTLELTFADDVNLATQLGRTFDLFDWTGVHPTGAFAVSSSYTWDLSNLFTTGEVTLTAVPEPTSLAAMLLGLPFVLASTIKGRPALKSGMTWNRRESSL
jgi:uncharacterized protein YjbI with pentapeptide repeats